MSQVPSPNGGKQIVQSRAEGVKQLLEKMKPNIASVLPKHLTPERLIKVVLTAAIRTPLLYECTKESLMQSVMLAAQLGLDCGGALGSAYLIPFKRNKKNSDGSWSSHYECQLIIGYRGMIDLARRSGQIVSIAARPVCKGDVFEMEYGLTERLVHRPNQETTPTTENLIGCYVVAHFVGGGHHVEWMNKAQIDAIRKRSKAADDGPWVTDPIEMAKKTVVRRAFKYLPMSIELQQSLSETVTTDGGRMLEDIIDGTATELDAGEPEKTGAQKVLESIQAGAAKNGGSVEDDSSEPGPAISTPAAPAAEPIPVSIPTGKPQAAVDEQPRPTNTGTVDRAAQKGRTGRAGRQAYVNPDDEQFMDGGAQ